MASSNYGREIINYLCNQFNLPEEQVNNMLPEFKKTLQGHMDNLEEVSRSKTLSSLEKAAHTIKGAFLNLGLEDCADLALKIEKCAGNGDAAVDYDALIGQLRETVDTIIQEQTS